MKKLIISMSFIIMSLTLLGGNLSDTLNKQQDSAIYIPYVVDNSHFITKKSLYWKYYNPHFYSYIHFNRYLTYYKVRGLSFWVDPWFFDDYYFGYMYLNYWNVFLSHDRYYRYNNRIVINRHDYSRNEHGLRVQSTFNRESKLQNKEQQMTRHSSENKREYVPTYNRPRSREQFRNDNSRGQNRNVSQTRNRERQINGKNSLLNQEYNPRINTSRNQSNTRMTNARNESNARTSDRTTNTGSESTRRR